MGAWWSLLVRTETLTRSRQSVPTSSHWRPNHCLPQMAQCCHAVTSPNLSTHSRRWSTPTQTMHTSKNRPMKAHTPRRQMQITAKDCCGWWDGPSPEPIKESGSCGDSEGPQCMFQWQTDESHQTLWHIQGWLAEEQSQAKRDKRGRTREISSPRWDQHSAHHIESIPVTWLDKGKLDRIPGWENLGLQQRFRQADFYLSGRPHKK